MFRSAIREATLQKEQEGDASDHSVIHEAALQEKQEGVVSDEADVVVAEHADGVVSDEGDVVVAEHADVDDHVDVQDAGAEGGQGDGDDTKKICWSCAQTADTKLRKCGSCRIARYCNRECLENHRSAHVEYCNAIIKARAAEVD